MRTLTHEPLALGGVLLLLVAIVAAFTVWVALRIQTRSGRAGAGTECVEGALGAAGPGVVSLVRPTPGPDTKTRPSAMGGGKSAGSRDSARARKGDGVGSTSAADMAPEGAPAAFSGATPGDLLVRDFLAWQDAGKPGTWPISVVPGRTEGDPS